MRKISVSDVIWRAFENTTKPLLYKTRDSEKNDIKKDVSFKEPNLIYKNSICAFCGEKISKGLLLKKAISNNFTDYNLLYESDLVCEKCLLSLNLYRYSFIASETLRLLNIREMAEEIQKPLSTPFVVVVSISQKKHLFFKSIVNYYPDEFVANLEEEKISINLLKLQEQFIFVGGLQALGESKERLKTGEIKYDILRQIGLKSLNYLKNNLKDRQIQLPLYLSQKPDITEEEAIKRIKEVIG